MNTQGQPGPSGTRGTPGTVMVLGSANADYLIGLPHLPREGETILSETFLVGVGGKGANQAVAASLLGGSVAFCGAVGDDADGTQLRSALHAAGVDITELSTVRAVRTGFAMVCVASDGKNSIVVVPGANENVTDGSAHRLITAAGPSSVLVTQGEIPQRVVDRAMRLASEHAVRCVFNLAPYREVSTETLAMADPLVVNESECSATCGFPVESVEDAVRAALQLSQVARSVVVTLGDLGAVWAIGDEFGTCSAVQVDTVVDTSGAGDALVGALALGLASGASLEESVRFGVSVGSFAVTRSGTQTSYPDQDELARFTERHR